MKAALKRPSGVICCQGECIWLDLPLIKKLMAIARNLFPSVAYGNVFTPTYPCGALGFLVCSLDKVYVTFSLVLQQISALSDVECQFNRTDR